MERVGERKGAAVLKPKFLQRPTPELSVGRAHFGSEIKRRLPWILLSVAAGVVMILIGQGYEHVLAQKIQLVYFIPMIVYMSDSIGTETLALFVRELALRRLSLRHIFIKELFVGLFLGAASGLPMGLLCYLWLWDVALSATVACAMIINGMFAVLIGMVVPTLFARFGRDPAVGTEEIATAISDNLSMLVYFIVATLLLFWR